MARPAATPPTTTTRPMAQPDDPLAEALALLGDPSAGPELAEAVAAYRRAERIRTDGPVRAARLQAIARAARLLADAAADGALPGEAVEVASLAAIARAAHRDHDRLDAELLGPTPRWRLLTALASAWRARGHHLGNAPLGKFHRFAQAVGEAAGVEVTHHAVRQLCESHSKKSGRRIPHQRQTRHSRARQSRAFA